MKLTVKVKLITTSGQNTSLLKTMEVFNQACNYASEVAFTNKTFGQIGIHKLCYYELRQKFNLSSQLAVRAIGKVAESYKADKKVQHAFKPHSAIVYDQRILSFKGLDLVSILSLDGRLKIPIVFGSYANLEQRRVRGQADLIYQKGHFYLCLVVEVPDGEPIDPQGILGIDLGIINLATTSDGQTFSGKQVDTVRKKITKFKSILQKKGTKSAKRHLKKLSGRERRFKKITNHTIAKQVVRLAKDTRRAIALENLKGFRVTVRKSQRERLGKWAFDELQRFITYKAQLAGVPISQVNPRNTSRECSSCGYTSKTNRLAQSEFICTQCGFSLHADHNAALNIASRAAINPPIAVHSLLTVLGTAMPRQLAAG